MNKKILLLIALVTVFSLGLAACGGGSAGGDDAVTAGKDLFAQTVIGAQAGCITCHSLEADTVIVGPSMAGIGSRATEDYLRKSILEPDANLVDGFPAGTMPQVWADELSDEQLDNLVAYLLSLK